MKNTDCEKPKGTSSLSSLVICVFFEFGTSLVTTLPICLSATFAAHVEIDVEMVSCSHVSRVNFLRHGPDDFQFC